MYLTPTTHCWLNRVDTRTILALLRYFSPSVHCTPIAWTLARAYFAHQVRMSLPKCQNRRYQTRTSDIENCESIRTSISAANHSPRSHSPWNCRLEPCFAHLSLRINSRMSDDSCVWTPSQKSATIMEYTQPKVQINMKNLPSRMSDCLDALYQCRSNHGGSDAMNVSQVPSRYYRCPDSGKTNLQDMLSLSSRVKDLKYKASNQLKGWIVKLIALCSRRGKMDQIQ